MDPPTAAARTDAEATTTQNQTGITPSTLRKTLLEELQATHVEIEDMSGGCGQMFAATIVSSQFASKKGMLQRHRLVNGVLKEEIKAIHAWTPRCYTPEEWEKRGGESKGT